MTDMPGPYEHHGAYAALRSLPACEIDLMTGWCRVHDTDCGPQRDFEAVDYVPDETDPDAYPDRGRITPGRVPDEIRRPRDPFASVVDDA